MTVTADPLTLAVQRLWRLRRLAVVAGLMPVLWQAALLALDVPVAAPLALLAWAWPVVIAALVARFPAGATDHLSLTLTLMICQPLATLIYDTLVPMRPEAWPWLVFGLTFGVFFLWLGLYWLLNRAILAGPGVAMTARWRVTGRVSVAAATAGLRSRADTETPFAVTGPADAEGFAPVRWRAPHLGPAPFSVQPPPAPQRLDPADAMVRVVAEGMEADGGFHQTVDAIDTGSPGWVGRESIRIRPHPRGCEVLGSSRMLWPLGLHLQAWLTDGLADFTAAKLDHLAGGRLRGGALAMRDTPMFMIARYFQRQSERSGPDSRPL